MADASRLYKVDFHVSHLDSQCFVHRTQQIAAHPSESDKHLVQRLLAWAIFQDEQITFSHSVCIGTEPDVFVKRSPYRYKHWIEVDQLQPDRLEKAEAKSEHVWLFYSEPDKAKKLLSQINKHPILQLVEIEDQLIAQLCAHLKQQLQWNIMIDQQNLMVAIDDLFIQSTFTLHHPVTRPALDLIH